MKDERLHVIVEDFRESLELAGRSETTCKAYTNTATRFLQRTRKIDPKAISKKDITRFLAELRDQGVTDRSRARHGYALRALLAFLQRSDLANEVPIAHFRFGLPKYMSKREVNRLIENAADQREKTIFSVGYYLALRRAEVSRLKLSDLDLAEGFASVKGKGGFEERIPIDKECLPILQNWIDSGQALKGDGYVFGSFGPDAIGRAFKKAAKRAGLEDVSFHALRHSRASHLLKDGLDLFHVHKLLRHRRLDSTSIYLHLLPLELKKALSKVKRLEEELELEEATEPGTTEDSYEREEQAEENEA